MVEEIRIMWYEVLEELLQCPVCLDAYPGIKNQCANGHHICSACRNQLQQCPMCKSHFIATRSLAVEQITAKLKDIQLSLLQPHHAINRRMLKNKVCVSTQTEGMSSTSSACQTEPTGQPHFIKRNEQQRPINLAPKIGKGVYPCRIGSCAMELPHGRIIGHLRYHHKDSFYEFSTRGTVFNQKWTVEYIFNQDYHFAFLIKEMGLFFLNICIHERGDLTATVQIVNCIPVSKQFTYTLETGNGPNSIRYTGLVKSCRVRLEYLSNNCLNIRADTMHRIIDHKNSFNCILTIKRKINNREIAAEDNIIEVPAAH